MSKRQLLPLLFLLVLTVLALIFFFKDDIIAPPSPYRAVPAESALLFRLDDPDRQIRSFREDSLWQTLRNYELPATLNRDLSLLDSIFVDRQALFGDSRLLIAVDRSGAEETGILFIMEQAAENRTGASRSESPVQKYKGISFYDYQRADMHMQGFNYKNLFICSSNDFMLERSVDALRSGTPFTGSSDWKALKEFSGKNNHLKCYVQVKKLPDLLATVLNEKGKKGSEEKIGHLGDWAALDLLPIQGSLYLNGYLSVHDSLSPLLLLQPAQPGGRDMSHVLPFNTAAFFQYHARSFDALTEQPAVPDEARDIYLNYFVNWLGSYAGIGFEDALSGSAADHAFLLLEAVDTFLAHERLTALAAANIPGNRAPFSRYKGHKIYRLSEFGQLDATLGLRSEHFKDPWFLFLGNYVVFANREASLKLLAERYDAGRTLSSDPDYQAFAEQMSSPGLLTLYANTARSFQLLKEAGNERFAAYLDQNFSHFAKLSPVGLQFSQYRDGIFLINGFMKSSGQMEKANKLLWKTELDTSIAFGPVLVKNHNNGKAEILAQDAKGKLYLISGNGALLWKKQLDGPIVGEVRQVDFYRNGKLQYLFTSKHSIYLIDRLGRNVENFPLRLPSAISSGIAAIDYNRNGNYRIFLACENGNIYGFDKSGKPLRGWSPRTLGRKVPFPIAHFVADTRDYLMILDEKGTLYLLNRKGKNRKGPFELKSTFMQGFYAEPGRRGFELLNMDTRGVLYRINDREEISRDTLVNTSGRVLFRYVDLDHDGKKEYLVMDEEYLRVFDGKEALRFVYPLPDDVVKDIKILEIRGEKHIALYSRSKERIYMLDASGKELSGFPLPGLTAPVAAPFLSADDWLLVSGRSDHTLSAYRLR